MLKPTQENVQSTHASEYNPIKGMQKLRQAGMEQAQAESVIEQIAKSLEEGRRRSDELRRETNAAIERLREENRNMQHQISQLTFKIVSLMFAVNGLSLLLFRLFFMPGS